MSNSDVEYENDLADQLGWDEANRTQYEVPYTILKYHKIIEANNRVSIFDTDDYNIPIPPTNDNCGNAPKPNPDDSLPDNGKVIRVISGRGRGGRSIYQKPGTTASQEYEDVTRYLRKVAPLGYGNAITENALRRNRALKKEENKENIQTPTLDNSSNTINKKNDQSESASKVTASTTTSSNSSEYFDTRDDLNNSSIERSTVSPELFQDINSENTTLKEEPAKITAVPLSELLRKSREQYRKMRLQKLKNSEENGPIKLVKPPDTLI